MKISERLKELRIDSGLTQEQLSNELKIGQTTVSSYESGYREPHIESLKAYAEFFKVSVDYLLGREEDIPVSAGKVITSDESELLATYRNLSPSMKSMCLDYAKMLKNRS